MINPEGDKLWVALKYERIVGLCYSCGRLGHEVKTCPHRGSASNVSGDGNLPYGDWLRAGTKPRGDEPWINVTGQARDHDHGRNETPRGTHPNLRNLSGLTRTTATREETTPDIRDETGQTSAISGRAE